MSTPDGDVLVDVGVPTYGEPRFLGEAIQSVLDQTLTSWRATVSENGARSDYVAGMVEPFLSDSRVQYVTTGTNIGGAGNSTRLIRSGRAPYVALLHDDDLWQPGFLERRVAFLEEHPSCGLIFSACDVIDQTGKVLYHFDVDLPEGIQDRKKFLRLSYRTNVIIMPTVLVRRSAYEAVGAVFNESLLFYDFEMWLRIASKFDVAFLPGGDASYRVHPSQTTQSVRGSVGQHRLQAFEALDSVLPDDISPTMRRRGRFVSHVRSGVDAFASGRVGESAGHFGRAVRVHPLGPVDPLVAMQVVRRLRRRTQDRMFWTPARERERDQLRPAGSSDQRAPDPREGQRSTA